MKNILQTTAVAAALIANVSAASSDRLQSRDRPFDYAIIFGDSYSDDGRGNYFFTHGVTFPPPGTQPNETDVNASGGHVWGQYIEQNTGATVYDYAFGGSTCSNSIVSRYDPFYGVDVPAVLDTMVPSFQNDSKSALYANVTPDNAVYSIWIGTNDLGNGGFLTDDQAPGKTTTDFVNCIWSSYDGIYAAGGRRLIIYNLHPMDVLPVYQTPEKGGTLDNLYWSNKTAYDMDAMNQKMANIISSINQEISSEVENNIKTRWPEAKVSIFDIHQFALDIYNNPSQYLEAPYNATWYYNDCPQGTGTCPPERLLDSYMWYDGLHPSNKTEDIVAQEYVNVAAGTSKYGIYY